MQSYHTDGLRYDDLIAGDLAVTVAEPSTWIVLAIGVAGVVRYRSKKQATNRLPSEAC